MSVARAVTATAAVAGALLGNASCDRADPADAAATENADASRGSDGSGAHDGDGGDAATQGPADASPDGPPCLPHAAGLLAWWTADGTPTDYLKQHDGTAMGPLGFEPGVVGQAFSFQPDSWVEVPETPALELTAELTIEGWVKIRHANATGRILDKITVGGIEGYMMDVVEGKLRLLLDVPDRNLSSAMVVPVDRFVHVAGTYDGAEMRVYIDGALSASLTRTGPIGTNDRPLRIALDNKEVNPINSFPGAIDELALYSRALRADEISAIATARTGRCH